MHLRELRKNGPCSVLLGCEDYAYQHRTTAVKISCFNQRSKHENFASFNLLHKVISTPLSLHHNFALHIAAFKSQNA